MQVHEEFLGSYHVDRIDAATVSAVVQDVFVRLNISMERLRGQCYDGASSMTGSIAKRISELELRALFTHCYGHALNLAACEVMWDALEITKLIKLLSTERGYFSSGKELIHKQFS